MKNYTVLIFLTILSISKVQSQNKHQNNLDTLGKKNGEWITILSPDSSSNGQVTTIICNYKNSVYHGLFEVYEREELIYKTYYIEGIKNGLEILYSNNVPQEINTYEKGELVNKILFYDNARTQEEINYKNGKRHGTYRLYYPSGKIQKTSFYSNGLQVSSERIYNRRGRLKTIYKYNQDGVLVDIYKY